MVAENFDAGFDLEKSYNESFKDLKENTIVTASVIDISSDTVFLDLGYKSEAKVLISEFEEVPKVGDEVEIYLVRLEGKNGDPVVSKKRCEMIREKAELENIVNEGRLVDGKVVDVQRGGFIVQFKNLSGFIPFSLFDVRRVDKPEEFKGQKIQFYIERINTGRGQGRRNDRRGNNANANANAGGDFVANRRKFLKDESKKLKEEFFNEKQVGDEMEGVVKNITDFGAFVDLGCLEALLHIKDISWVRIDKVTDVLKVGDRLKVKILNIDSKKGKVAVGLKQMEEEPWDRFVKQYSEGDNVTGTVSSIVPYGAFIKIIDGVEGLLHISDMSWTKNVKNPSELLKPGQQAEVKIIGVNLEDRKINLSLKHLLENPWDNVEEKYPVGSKVKGKVKTITSFGAFVELEEGVEALLHKDEISWTERIDDVNEYFQDKENTEMDIAVISVDKENRKIKVGIKQLSDDPWVDAENTFKRNTLIECEILSIDNDKGIEVKISDKISAFVPYNEVDYGNPEDIKADIKNRFEVGTKVNVVVQNVDYKRRQVNLSIKDYFKMEEKKKVQEFLHDHKEDGKFTLADMIKSKKDD